MFERISAICRPRSAPLAVFFTAFVLVFLLVFGASVLITFILPESYASTARIRVERDGNDAQPQTDSRQVQWSYDPYFIQTEFEVIQSEVILGKAIDALNLNVEWGKTFAGGEKLKASETLAMLKSRLDLRPVRSTSLIEIRAYSDNPNEAAKIANAIAEAYRDHRLVLPAQMSLAKIKALEATWKVQNEKLQAAAKNLLQLRGELQVPTPEPAEEELLAKYPSYAEAKQHVVAWQTGLVATGREIAEAQAGLSLPRRSAVEIIDRAIPSLYPVRPNKPLNIVLGAFGGMMLALVGGGGAALAASLIGKKARDRAAAS